MSSVDRVVAVARTAVARLAPEEMGAFDRVAGEWSRPGVARRRSPGTDGAPMTATVLRIVAAALHETQTGRPPRWWDRWISRRRRTASHRRRALHRRPRRAAAPPADADRLRAVVARHVAVVCPDAGPARHAVVRDAILGAWAATGQPSAGHRH